MQIPDPTPEHLWLRQLSGEWKYESSCQGPDGESMVMRGSESIRMLGELWSVATMRGDMPGDGSMEAVMCLGYDPARGKFLGSWVGSPMTTFFTYEGQLDSARKILTLDTVGPDFADPTKTAHYQDIIEMVDENTKIFRSQGLNEDGSWTEFMRSMHTRA